MASLSAFDTTLFRLVNAGPHPLWLDMAAVWLTRAGAAWWLLIFGAPFVWRRASGRWRLFCALLIPSAVLSRAAALFLKALLARPRPFLTLDHVRLLLPVDGLGAHGLPSSHAANTAVVAALAWLCAGPSAGTWLLTALAIVVSASRVYAGVHYPGDVLLGAAVGAGSAAIVRIVHDRWYARKTDVGRRRWRVIFAALLAAVWIGATIVEHRPPTPVAATAAGLSPRSAPAR